MMSDGKVAKIPLCRLKDHCADTKMVWRFASLYRCTCGNNLKNALEWFYHKCDFLPIWIWIVTISPQSPLHDLNMTDQPTKQKLWGGRFTGKTDPLYVHTLYFS
jgi:hypothetical protein